MTDEPEARPSGASWVYVRSLERRVAELELWRATQDAVATWRRWAVPITATGVGVAVNLVITLSRIR